MKLLEITFIAILTFGVFFGGTVLAAHSAYRADVRSCISNEGGSEADCEAKFK